MSAGTNCPGPETCPACGEPNACTGNDACWCAATGIDARLLQRMRDAGLGDRCLCRRCVASADFAADGCQFVAGLLDPAACAALAPRLVELEPGSAGTRCLLSEAWCRQLARQLAAHPVVAAVLPPDAVALQCTLFEKSVERNWLVPMHQDLSVPVAERVDHAQLRGWSTKEGRLQVQPPAALLQRLVALRLQVDDCGADDGPLRVLPGTHLAGRLDEVAASSLRRAPPHGERACTARSGQGWLMRPLLLHASSRARGCSRRRVLHFVWGPADPPLGLRWPQPAG